MKGISVTARTCLSVDSSKRPAKVVWGAQLARLDTYMHMEPAPASVHNGDIASCVVKVEGSSELTSVAEAHVAALDHSGATAATNTLQQSGVQPLSLWPPAAQGGSAAAENGGENSQAAVADAVVAAVTAETAGGATARECDTRPKKKRCASPAAIARTASLGLLQAQTGSGSSLAQPRPRLD